MKKIYIIVLSLILILSFVLLPNWGYGKPNLEKHAREEMCVDDHWDGVMAIHDSIAAFLFYDETGWNYTYVLFINWPTPYSLGYFFSSGGCTGDELLGVVKYENNLSGEVVYLSMNQQSVDFVTIETNGVISTLNIDPTKPFAISANRNENYTFYSQDGQEISCMDSGLSFR